MRPTRYLLPQYIPEGQARRVVGIGARTFGEVAAADLARDKKVLPVQVGRVHLLVASHSLACSRGRRDDNVSKSLTHFLGKMRSNKPAPAEGSSEAGRHALVMVVTGPPLEDGAVGEGHIRASSPALGGGARLDR